MATEVENRLITLNSANGIQRNSTKLSDMLFNFQNVLSDEDDIISSNICVMNCQIPVSFYIINSTNYQFVVTTTIPSLSTTVTLAFGNYTANSLVTAINSALSATTVSVSFIQLTGKLKFTNSSGGNITVLDVGSGIVSAYKVIGYGSTTGYTAASPSTMPYPLNLLGVKKLSIKSQLLGITSFQSGTNQSTTLATIPNNNAPYTMINYENQSNLNKALIKVRKIDAIDIQIEDENGNKVDFNFTDWTLTLVLENIRKMKRAEVPHFLQIMEDQNKAVATEDEIPDGLYGN
jgi:hypothetical protein